VWEHWKRSTVGGAACEKHGTWRLRRGLVWREESMYMHVER
jgi:hypothetical protein